MSSPAPSDRRRPRAPRPQAVLTVRSRVQLNAHTVRVVAGGPGFAEFRDNEFTDKYAKLVFTDPGDGREIRRTYTVRRVEPDEQQLTLDFVVHGDHGIAAPWAARAEPGDALTLSGAGGGYRPADEVAWHLFLGDESALPAICSALESLPATARGLAYLETSDDAEQLDVEPPAGINVRWLHRPLPGTRPDLLAEALREGPWPDGAVDVFAHGERESMKAVRAELKARLGDADHLSLSGYWAAGRTEDVFQAEKRQPIGQLEPA